VLLVTTDVRITSGTHLASMAFIYSWHPGNAPARRTMAHSSVAAWRRDRAFTTTRATRPSVRPLGRSPVRQLDGTVLVVVYVADDHRGRAGPGGRRRVRWWHMDEACLRTRTPTAERLLLLVRRLSSHCHT